MLVTATNVDAASSRPSNATQVISPYPPANTARPTISGIAQRRHMLIATLATWTGPGNSYSYEWQQDFGDGYADIPGATGPTYALAESDEGSTVRVVVSAANPLSPAREPCVRAGP